MFIGLFSYGTAKKKNFPLSFTQKILRKSKNTYQKIGVIGKN
jgi:hypothetical protein